MQEDVYVFTENGLEQDKKRTKFLQDHGYTLIGRCRWSKFVKMSQDSKREYVENVINLLKG